MSRLALIHIIHGWVEGSLAPCAYNVQFGVGVGIGERMDLMEFEHGVRVSQGECGSGPECCEHKGIQFRPR